MHRYKANYKEHTVVTKIYPSANINHTSYMEFIHEAKILMQLNHPNIIKIHKISFSNEYNSIVMEYAAKNSLEKILRTEKFSYEDTWIYILQIAKGLQYLHEIDIVHGDLNIDNILMNQNYQIKIADFGLSYKMIKSNPLTNYNQGQSKYMAPESYRTKESDIYSFGKVIENLIKSFNNKIDFYNLIASCCDYESRNRPKINDIINQIEEKVYKLQDKSVS